MSDSGIPTYDQPECQKAAGLSGERRKVANQSQAQRNAVEPAAGVGRSGHDALLQRWGLGGIIIGAGMAAAPRHRLTPASNDVDHVSGILVVRSWPSQRKNVGAIRPRTHSTSGMFPLTPSNLDLIRVFLRGVHPFYRDISGRLE